MKQLIKHIKDDNFKTVYLFFGEETFLVNLYEQKVLEKVIDPGFSMMNLNTFEGKTVTADDIDNAASTLPFMSEKRLVFVKNSGLFTTGKKDETEKVSTIINDLPDTTILIFVETEVDKRNRLYKEVVKIGYAVDFKTPDERELIDWVIRTFKGFDKTISQQDAVYLLKTVTHNMSNVYGEIVKLRDYTGVETNVTKAHIDGVCVKSLDSKIFEMTKAMVNKNSSLAIDIFNNLIFAKEQPIAIIGMIAWQFRMMLQAKLWAQTGANPYVIAENMGQKSFTVNESLHGARQFTFETLESALKDCLETDIAIKTGVLPGNLAVELLILKYSSK